MVAITKYLNGSKSQYGGSKDTMPTQLSLPIVGKMPTVITLGPLPMSDLILHGSKYLIDSVIRPTQKTHIGFCYYEITAPNAEAVSKICAYLRGELK